MVVQHNLTAMNSNRMLGVTTGSQAKSTEKLSSGYKINRAADDAAGLAISEKMRKQIRGLTQASTNAQDGISSVQTAEGALTEVHDMLQRMNELAVKAANGTNSETDRSYIQSEIDQLVTEIDRVSTTTKFNETYLLKGTNPDGTPAKLTYDTANTATGLTFTDGVAEEALTVADDEAITDKGTYDVTSYDVTEGSDTVTYYVISDLQDDDAAAGNTIAMDDAVADFEGGSSDKYVQCKDLDELASKVSKALDPKGGNIKSVSVTSDDKLKISAFADLNDGLNLDLHVGADGTQDNKIELNIGTMSARGLGVNGIRVDGATADNATKAIDTIAAAIQKVSSQRSALGAVQNRLEHTIANLDNIVENTTSAESAIRDTDMASEMVKYSNNNILAQAGTSMLAQANQSNQNILSLLG